MINDASRINIARAIDGARAGYVARALVACAGLQPHIAVFEVNDGKMHITLPGADSSVHTLCIPEDDPCLTQAAREHIEATLAATAADNDLTVEFQDPYDAPTAGTAAADMINRPPHYTSHPSGAECITVMRELPGSRAAAWKYLFRRNEKGNPKQDIKKACWFIRDALDHPREVEKESAADARTLLTAAAVAAHEPWPYSYAMMAVASGCGMDLAVQLLERKLEAACS